MALHQTNQLHPHQQMVSSSAGALLVSMFTTPFDVVKVRLQAQLKSDQIRCSVANEFVETTACFCVPQIPSRYNSPVMCAHGNIRTVPWYTSTQDAFFKIAKREGVPKLWKGLAPTLVQSVPQTVVYFTVYDQLKVKLGFIPGEKNIIPSLTAGTLARSLAVIAVSPLEMARTKFQSKRNFRYCELLTLLYYSVKHEGFSSMWRGITPTIMRDVPFSALYWVNYELIKSLHSNPNIIVTFYAGAISGMIAAFFTHPFDVIKTYRQIELGEGLKGTSLSPSTQSTAAVTNIINHLYRTRGMASLYTGLVPRLAKVTPSCAIMISTYEYGKKYFASLNNADI